MRRLTSILIVTGAVLAAAQAAVADLASVPITVTSQTLQASVNLSGDTSSTGDVIGGSSIATSWNFGSENGSSIGTVLSVVNDGELIIVIDGSLSSSGINSFAEFAIQLEFLFGFAVPDFGESTTPIFLQMTRTSSELAGTFTRLDLNSMFGVGGGTLRAYTSQMIGGPVVPGSTFGILTTELPSVTHDPVHFIPADRVTAFPWSVNYNVGGLDENSTVTFSETYTFRALTPIPLPEPSASLTLPSGVGLLYALSKLRGVSLIH